MSLSFKHDVTPMSDLNIDKTGKDSARAGETVEETLARLRRDLELSLSDSIHDRDTHLYSAAYFHARLQEEIVRSERYRHFLGLILIHLELRHGGTTTQLNHALRQVGTELTGGLTRRTDIVALYRKRQMIIMLPETDAKGANLLVQRYEAMFPSNGRRLSCSVLTYPHDASNIESILARLQGLSEEHFRQHA
jgi:GGDEF domain-containing protein